MWVGFRLYSSQPACVISLCDLEEIIEPLIGLNFLTYKWEYSVKCLELCLEPRNSIVVSCCYAH